MEVEEQGPSNVEPIRKRSAESVLVDPDTLQTIEHAKKPKIELNEIKHACFSAIVEMYHTLIRHWFPVEENKLAAADGAAIKSNTLQEEALSSITVGNHITSIIFTLHNVARQSTKGVTTNLMTKTATTSFKIHFKGKDYSIGNLEARNLWLVVTAGNKLEYKNFQLNDKDNWYDRMGAYLNIFSFYAFRVNELRLGHNNMQIVNRIGRGESFPVAEYGLSGAHHILLEGTSFPPVRKYSLVQSLGPMTAWLCMLTNEGIYRKKYAAAVKQAMSHIPAIDDLIELTKTIKESFEISEVTTLLAEILMITTARQATMMFFPIAMFAAVWRSVPSTADLCGFFSIKGSGGWYVYKLASERRFNFTISGNMEEEKASQIVFHAIFGTYKEDLGVLAEMTDCGRWYTRKEMGDCFKAQGEGTIVTKVRLPKIKFYPKVSSANQTGLLSEARLQQDYQVSTIPCFSGPRIQVFGEDYFEHIVKRRTNDVKRRTNDGTSCKNIRQIKDVFMATLEELHMKLLKDNGKLQMGTTEWKDFQTLELGKPGDTIDVIVKGTKRYFFGRYS